MPRKMPIVPFPGIHAPSSPGLSLPAFHADPLVDIRQGTNYFCSLAPLRRTPGDSHANPNTPSLWFYLPMLPAHQTASPSSMRPRFIGRSSSLTTCILLVPGSPPLSSGGNRSLLSSGLFKRSGMVERKPYSCAQNVLEQRNHVKE